MDRQDAKRQLDELLALEPKRETFQDEEDYQEALAGFKHRAGPLIRSLQSQASPEWSESQATEK